MMALCCRRAECTLAARQRVAGLASDVSCAAPALRMDGFGVARAKGRAVAVMVNIGQLLSCERAKALASVEVR